MFGNVAITNYWM